MRRFLLLIMLMGSFKSSYAQAGGLDRSFGTNGIVSGDFGEKYNYSGITKKILSKSDGTIYAILEVSGKTLITKTLSDGSVDVSYGHKGFSSFSNILTNDAALQSDGKIVVAGSANSHFAIVRYNTDGSIDNAFSQSQLIKEHYDYDAIYSVAIQPDGKILLGGVYGIDEDNSNFILTRLTTFGNPDSTFGVDGVQLNYGTFFDVSPTAVAVQSDNKIVVAASYHFADNNFLLFRYNRDGGLDSSFSEDGTQTTSFLDENGQLAPSVSTSLVIQSNGKIVVAGRINNSYIGIAKYNADGSLDNNFSNDGKEITSIPGFSSSLAIQEDEKIVVGGQASFGRYNADGSKDLTFNKNGVQYVSFNIVSLAIPTVGKIVAAGYIFETGNYKLSLVRYNTNGSTDVTYGEGGKLVVGIEAGNTVYTSTAIQKDGKIVSAGKTWNGKNFDFIVTRYNPDGSIDPTFSGSGKQTFDFASTDDYAYSVAIQNDGKIVVGGNSGNDTRTLSLVRYNIDGSLDNAFNQTVKASISSSNPSFFGADVIIQNDGKILVSGSGIIRFNNNGNLDNTFGKNGMINSDFISRKIAIESDGKILAAGTWNDNFAIARLNTNGSFDNSFSGDGIQTIEYTDYDDKHSSSQASLVAIQNDGKIIVSGSGTVRGRFFPEYTEYLIARFNADGSRDNTFFHRGNATGIVPQNEEKIIISESHTIYRINNIGSTDSTFEEIQTTDYDINSIKIANNKLYAVGSTGTIGIVARYLLDDKSGAPPTVSLTTPTNNTIRLAPANIWLTATASDADGAITKVEFYNGSHLLHTEYVTPYGFKWRNIPVGNYTLTAKAYDNNGLVTTSAPIHISVVPNKPPIVSIIKPVVKQTVAAPGYIHLEADAKDEDGRIARVEFYNGSTLIRTEYEAPYTYHWENVPRGTYTITAVAVDNWAARTTSAPVTIRVVNPPVTAANKSASEDDKTDVNSAISINLAPNPANDMITITTEGLQRNKQLMLQIISSSGAVMKTMQSMRSTKVIQIDVSKLASGMYTVKIMSGDKIGYKQFVKL